MVDFIDEVNEDLRRERFNSFWQKVGGYVIAVSAVIILATVGSVLWQNYTKDRQMGAAEAFLAADKTLRGQEFAEAAEQYAEVADRGAEGFTDLARMKQAYALTRAEKLPEAVALYKEIAEDGKADKAARAFARIYAAQLLQLDGKTREEVDALLTPLAEDADSPFSTFAREQQAHAALHYGDGAAAQKMLADLSADMAAPASLRRRAQAQLATFEDRLPAAEADDAANNGETAEQAAE